MFFLVQFYVFHLFITNEQKFTFWETVCVAHSAIIRRVYVIFSTFINIPCHNSIEIYQISRHISIDLLILHTDFALKIAVYCVYDKASIFVLIHLASYYSQCQESGAIIPSIWIWSIDWPIFMWFPQLKRTENKVWKIVLLNLNWEAQRSATESGKMNDNGRGQLLKHKSNGVYTPTTEPRVSVSFAYDACCTRDYCSQLNNNIQSPVLNCSNFFLLAKFNWIFIHKSIIIWSTQYSCLLKKPTRDFSEFGFLIYLFSATRFNKISRDWSHILSKRTHSPKRLSAAIGL